MISTPYGGSTEGVYSGNRKCCVIFCCLPLLAPQSECYSCIFCTQATESISHKFIILDNLSETRLILTGMFQRLMFVSSYFLASDILLVWGFFFSLLTLHLAALWFVVEHFCVIWHISYCFVLVIYYSILEFAPPWDCEPGMYVWNARTGLCCDGKAAWRYARDDSFQWEKSTSRTNN